VRLSFLQGRFDATGVDQIIQNELAIVPADGIVARLVKIKHCFNSMRMYCVLYALLNMKHKLEFFFSKKKAVQLISTQV
jgi:hypothetical protein